MRKLCFLLVFAGLGYVHTSCTSNSNSHKNIDLIDQYVKAIESKDMEAMASLLHEDYKGYGPSINDSTDKSQAIESWAYLSESYYEYINYDDFQNIAVTIDEGPQEGDWVSNWSILSLKFKDGRGPVKLYFNAVYKIVDGKIIHSRTFYNEVDVLEQLGYTF